ncbi:MAG: hypothetical protein PHG44_07430 [Lentisphaeria bacterium]|nr:hypothetical protein [Lentisphaeria bacterium]
MSQQLCERFREQAMRQGMQGAAAQLWRKHSKTCLACKSEIYILETLCRESQDSRQHISAAAYGNLLNTVNQLYGTRKQAAWTSRLWSFSRKALALAAMLIMMFKIAAPMHKMSSEEQSKAEQSRSPSAEEIFSDSFQTGADQGLVIAAQKNDEASAEIQCLPLKNVFEDISGNRLELELQKLRGSVSERINLYGELLDLELEGKL